MKLAAFALTPLIALASGFAAAKSTPPHFAASLLIAKAKAAPVALIDLLEVYCDTDTTIGVWLKRLTAREARAIAWTAGKCELVDDLNPLDAGGGVCAQATITLKHPKTRNDQPVIEVYFDDPEHGRPGPVFAFRSIMLIPGGGDYERSRKDFESDWRERFADTAPPACTDAS